MSDLLTHWAVYEDCRRLTPLAGGIEPLFGELIETEREYTRLGAITRGGNRWMTSILEHARDTWGQEEQHPRLGQKVAFSLGGLTHQACDNLMNPLMKRRADSKREISAYYDTHVFRQVYLTGGAEPFNRFLVADNDTAPGQALEAFVRSLFQRALLSSHTIKPDFDDVDAWLDRLFDAVQSLYIDINMYVDVFHQPDPDKVQRYGVETEFYRADDPAIQAARALQRGEKVSAEAAREALQEGANESHYAQALVLGITYLKTASAFWRREVETLSAPNVPAVSSQR